MNNSNTKSLGFDVSKFRQGLIAEIYSDIAALEFIRTKDDSAFGGTNSINIEQKFNDNPPYLIINTKIQILPKDFIVQREIFKCFCSIMRSIQDYMDKLIALQAFKNEGIKGSVNMSYDEVVKYFQICFAAEIMKIATNSKLGIPAKLNLIFKSDKNQHIKNSLQSLFELRNGYEHHKGYAKNDKLLTYKRLDFSTNLVEGQKIPDKVLVKTFLVDETVAFDQGNQMVLTINQLNAIIYSILTEIVPKMELEFNE